MKPTKQDLEATQQIVGILEASKSRSDAIFDNLPGIFVIVDREGFILKGSANLGRIMNCNHEDLLGSSLGELFRPTTWDTFKSKIRECHEHVNVEFALALDGKQQNKSNFVWHISVTPRTLINEKEIFCIFGQNVEFILKSSGGLSHFKSDDIGLLVIDAAGRINEFSSGFLQNVLNLDILVEGLEFEAVFASSLKLLNERDRDGLLSLLGSVGKELKNTSQSVEWCPKTIMLPAVRGDQGVSVRLFCFPVVKDGIIKNLMVGLSAI